MVNKIHLTESVILGSMVTIHQGAEVKSWTTIGNITRIISLQNGTSEADNHQFYLGVPAESVPLTSLSNTSPEHISSGMIKKWKYWLSMWTTNTVFQLKYLLALLVLLVLISISIRGFALPILCIYDEKCRHLCKTGN
ncbi:unnamed protein product [Rotaria sp. Silwood2]|nr:unnamed protein product [Rotaria sp. Silwood2]CAF4426811.1 unnamed protein product [Rotaria sp. Silwood2]